VVTAQDLRAQQPAGRYDPSTYVHTTEATRENSDFEFDRYDTYEWYLNVGQLSNIQTKILKDRTLPTRTRFRRASELRSVVAASGDAPVSHARHGADAQRGRLVGSGRLLRSGHDLSRTRCRSCLTWERRSRSTCTRRAIDSRKSTGSWCRCRALVPDHRPEPVAP